MSTVATPRPPCNGPRRPPPLPVSGPLRPSKSHKRRTWAFVTDAAGEHLGTLTIGQSAEVDSYAVEEDTSEPFPGRAFPLAKLDAAGDVYRVIVLSPARAVCSGEWCGRCPTCKHRDAILGLLADGVLDPELAAA